MVELRGLGGSYVIARRNGMSENFQGETRKPSGCGTWMVRGCCVLLVLVVVLAAVGFLFGRSLFQRGSGVMVEVLAEKELEKRQCPESLRPVLMEPLRELTAEIKAGRVPAEKMNDIGKELFKGSVLGPVLAPTFQATYIDPSSLSPIEKQILSRDVSRYAEGLRLQKIPEQTAGEIWNLVSEFRPGTGHDPDELQLKKTLTPEELKAAVEIMRVAANKAGMAEETFTFQPQDEIRQAIQRGLGRTPEQK